MDKEKGESIIYFLFLSPYLSSSLSYYFLSVLLLAHFFIFHFLRFSLFSISFSISIIRLSYNSSLSSFYLLPTHKLPHVSLIMLFVGRIGRGGGKEKLRGRELEEEKEENELKEFPPFFLSNPLNLLHWDSLRPTLIAFSCGKVDYPVNAKEGQTRRRKMLSQVKHPRARKGDAAIRRSKLITLRVHVSLS